QGEAYCSTDPGKIFKLQYLPILLDENGKESVTPARVDRYSGQYEASKVKLLPKTVPVRMCIFCHEYSHLHLNQDPSWELEADLNGLTIYLALGYPVQEAIETYEQTFAEMPTKANTVDRMPHIRAFISDFFDQFYSNTNKKTA
ncbi:MAG TPA: hypothetical protein VFV08_04645, partial [Puia sp.]|nr:hypothetical protein [Puia sp.]